MKQSIKGDICDEIRSKVAAVSSFVILRFFHTFSNSFFWTINYVTKYFYSVSCNWVNLIHFSLRRISSKESVVHPSLFCPKFELTIFLYIFIRLHWMSTIFPKDMIFLRECSPKATYLWSFLCLLPSILEFIKNHKYSKVYCWSYSQLNNISWIDINV